MLDDIICFSHQRWNFIYQRPQHIISRFATEARVFYFEDPLHNSYPDQLRVRMDADTGVHVVTPELEESFQGSSDTRIKKLLYQLMAIYKINRYICWYYSPTAMAFSQSLKPLVTVYDCTDELCGGHSASPEVNYFESLLFSKADIVFAASRDLCEQKKKFHQHIVACPSDTSFGEERIEQEVTEQPGEAEQSSACTSWDDTWKKMSSEVSDVVSKKTNALQTTTSDQTSVSTSPGN